MSKHTPGPWEYLLTTEEIIGGGQIICKIDTSRFGKRGYLESYPAEAVHIVDEFEATAILIAAAPELLEACKALQMEAKARGCGLLIADEAIAKAEL